MVNRNSHQCMGAGRPHWQCACSHAWPKLHRFLHIPPTLPQCLTLLPPSVTHPHEPDFCCLIHRKVHRREGDVHNQGGAVRAPQRGRALLPHHARDAVAHTRIGAVCHLQGFEWARCGWRGYVGRVWWLARQGTTPSKSHGATPQLLLNRRPAQHPPRPVFLAHPPAAVA